jgi:hypothetical protein
MGFEGRAALPGVVEATLKGISSSFQRDPDINASVYVYIYNFNPATTIQPHRIITSCTPIQSMLIVSPSIIPCT